MSAINWGEVTTALLRRHGFTGLSAARVGLTDLRIDIVDATASRAVRSAEIKFKYSLPYADAFCIELMGDSEDHFLITADFDMKPAEPDFHIEFLPPKPRL